MKKSTMKLNHSHNPIFRQWMSRPLWSIWRLVHTTICLFWNIWRCTSKMQWRRRFSIINDVRRSSGTNVIKRVHVDTLKVYIAIYLLFVNFTYYLATEKCSKEYQWQKNHVSNVQYHWTYVDWSRLLANWRKLEMEELIYWFWW